MNISQNLYIQDDTLEKVILVDSQNNQIDLMDKLYAHKCGALHRAFSVFIFSLDDKMLLQKRASTKYHSPNQWANACCGHPRVNETTLHAATRRLKEEMGLSATLKPRYELIYKAELKDNLVEHEYVEIFIGYTDQLPSLNPFEVSDYLWVSHDQLANTTLDLAPWFKIYLNKYRDVIDSMFGD